MEADYDNLEIVCVIHDDKLVDSESYERRYVRKNGQFLRPGYYVVSWPPSIRRRRFNEDAAFFGPFRRRDMAVALVGRH